LKEEEVTKFQTGGPDGDLGSNEILLSKDKTNASASCSCFLLLSHTHRLLSTVIDGSGTIHDSEGLDRTELVRLEKARVESHFIYSYGIEPSPIGFHYYLTQLGQAAADEEEQAQ
jgi:hypothetical protein